MANSEDIEARLCAYIEGDLSPAERAEIERHLEAHPGHRQMMADLVRMRNLVVGLPRMNAPIDLNEGLQAHLERSMLLGKGLNGEDAQSRWHSHLRRSAQMAILAAIVLLSVGLGSLVYYMLHAAAHPTDVASPAVQTAAQDTPPIDTAEPDADSPSPMVAMTPATRPNDTQPSSSVEADAAVESGPTTQESAPTTQEAVAAAPTTQQTEPTTLPSDAEDDLANSAIVADYPSSPATQPSAPTLALPRSTARLNSPKSGGGGQSVDLSATEIAQPTTAPVADDAEGK